MFCLFSSRKVVMQSHFLSSQCLRSSCIGSMWKLVILPPTHWTVSIKYEGRRWPQRLYRVEFMSPRT